MNFKMIFTLSAFVVSIILMIIMVIINKNKCKNTNNETFNETNTLPTQNNVLYTFYEEDNKYLLEPLENVDVIVTLKGKFTGWGENLSLIETTQDGVSFDLNPAMYIEKGYDEMGIALNVEFGTMKVSLKSTSTYELSRKNNEPFEIISIE